MRPRRGHLATAAMLLVSSSSACAGAGSGSDTDGASDRNRSEYLSTVSAGDFDRSNFDDSAKVDNQWFPLEPGAHSVFEGSAIDDGERISRRVVTTVTDLSKEIDGVNSVIVWERDYNEGKLVEAELGFFAQDTDGNVWHMGEYPEEFEDGEFDKAPGWIAGSKGATAGIAMRAEPRPRTPSYAQGYAPPPRQLDRSWEGVQGRPEDLCARRMLRGRSGDRGVRAEHSGRLPAQVLHAQGGRC
jgi:hypothetical protein